MNNGKVKTGIFAGMMMIAGILLLVFISYRIIASFSDLSGNYKEISAVNVSEASGEWVVMYHNDGILVNSSYGIEIDGSNPQMEEGLNDFLNDTVETVRQLEFSTFSTYAMFVTGMMLLFIYERNREDKKRQVILSVAVSIGVFIILILAVCLAMIIGGLPLSGFKSTEIVNLLTGALCVAGGNCAVMLLMRKIRFRKTVAVLLIPFLFFTYMFCGQLESRLLTFKETDSFDYVYEIAGEEGIDRVYYDDVKNVMVFDGKEYEAERVPNPDGLLQPYKTLAVIYEVLNPYSGISTDLAWYFSGYNTIPADILFMLKAVCWIVIPLIISKHRT